MYSSLLFVSHSRDDCIHYHAVPAGGLGKLQASCLYVGDATGEDQDAGDLFEDDEPIGMTKRELYKQNKEAKQMERLTRRMQGGSCCMHLAVSLCSPQLHVNGAKVLVSAQAVSMAHTEYTTSRSLRSASRSSIANHLF